MNPIKRIINWAKYRFVDKKHEDEIKEIEELFNRGEVIIPTDLRDYENLQEFKEKTSHIESIKTKIASIEDGKR